MSITLALDVGTTNLAALAYDQRAGTAVACCTAANPGAVNNLTPGHHELDPEAVWRGVRDLLRQLVGSGEFDVHKVTAIAITGQVHGLLLVDSSGTPLTNYFTWCDQRSAAVAAEHARKPWPVERTGCRLHTGYGGATLACLAAEKAIPPQARALSILDFIALRLGGALATDITQAANWGICDVRRRCWDDAALQLLQLDTAWLPPIYPDLAPLGALKADLGLPPDSEVQVILPMGDNQASFFGACGRGAKEPLLNLGTGGQISLPMETFSWHEGLETRPLPLGGFLLVGASLCGGRAYAALAQFFRRTITAFTGREPSSSEIYETMNRMAAASDSELCVDTRFAGSRTTPDALGSVREISLATFTPEALTRGLIRGMVNELAEMLPPPLRTGIERVVASGNAVRRNPLVPQFISEIFSAPCAVIASQEEAALGVASSAAAVNTHS